MRAGILTVGVVLLGLAFLSLAGEIAVRGPVETRGLYLSAEELWAGLAPQSHAEFRSWFRSAARPLWTFGFGPLLKAPAWLLLGLPGVLAVVYGRRRDAAPTDIDPDEVFLYEELAKRAKEEGHANADDRFPADDYGAAEASAREAAADLARNPIVSPPSESRPANPAPESDEAKPPPVNRPLS
ncbi:MAG: hypothetical protein FJW24_10315 [Acidimicrobiia bacterium]|nr:hypothetical protein [Acidimicrobiia bacterium]